MTCRSSDSEVNYSVIRLLLVECTLTCIFLFLVYSCVLLFKYRILKNEDWDISWSYRGNETWKSKVRYSDLQLFL